MKTVNDAIHGMIEIPRFLHAAINTRLFQRLHRVAQCGNLRLVWPSATHTRYAHSVGTAHLADEYSRRLEFRPRLRHAFGLASLLHDVGHGPFSHVFEMAIKGTETAWLIGGDHDAWRFKLIVEDAEMRSALGDLGGDVAAVWADDPRMATGLTPGEVRVVFFVSSERRKGAMGQSASTFEDAMLAVKKDGRYHNVYNVHEVKIGDKRVILIGEKHQHALGMLPWDRKEIDDKTDAVANALHHLCKTSKGGMEVLIEQPYTLNAVQEHKMRRKDMKYVLGTNSEGVREIASITHVPSGTKILADEDAGARDNWTMETTLNVMADKINGFGCPDLTAHAIDVRSRSAMLLQQEAPPPVVVVLGAASIANWYNDRAAKYDEEFGKAWHATMRILNALRGRGVPKSISSALELIMRDLDAKDHRVIQKLFELDPPEGVVIPPVVQEFATRMAALMDVYTVARIFSSRAKTVVVYAGYNHTKNQVNVIREILSHPSLPETELEGVPRVFDGSRVADDVGEFELIEAWRRDSSDPQFIEATGYVLRRWLAGLGVAGLAGVAGLVALKKKRTRRRRKSAAPDKSSPKRRRRKSTK